MKAMGDGLDSIKQFLADNNQIYAWIKTTISGEAGVVAKGAEYMGYVVTQISENLGEWLNLGAIKNYFGDAMDTVVGVEKYFAYQFEYDVGVLSFWGVIGFLGIAVFIWSIYILSAMLESVSEIEQFCAQ